MDKELRIEYVPLSELEKYPRNPKTHDLETLGASFTRFGFNDPIAIDEASGYMVEGHGRVKQLEAEKQAGKNPPARIKISPDGEWWVPVIYGISFDNEQELEAYMLAANRLTENGGWDDAKLADILRDLNKANATAGIGWNDRQISRLLNHVNPDDLPEGDPEYPQRRALQSSAAFKQLTLYFSPEEYEEVLEKLQTMMETHELDSHADVLRYLLNSRDQM